MPGRGRSDEYRWRIQWPRVPREIRASFARVSLTAAVVWAVLALYLSIVPSYFEALLHTTNLALGLAALVLASPLRSLGLLLAGAVLAGAGHGLGFLNAQDELNRIAPARRRGEVTAAFITCIYALVGVSVIATGLLDLRFSLTLSVGGVAVVLGALAVAAGLWHLCAARGLTNHRLGA